MRFELLRRWHERRMQLDKRSPGLVVVLETLLDPATARVGYVTPLAARGWPVDVGRRVGRRILHCLLEEALHIHKKVEGTVRAWKWLP